LPARRASRAPPHAPSDDPSADGLVQHHVRTTAGLVSLSWDPDQGAFVAARGQQTWGDARLGDLARTVGISIPAQGELQQLVMVGTLRPLLVELVDRVAARLGVG
jgi:hypothetical protein